MPKLIEEAKSNSKKFFLQFGGQGSPYLSEVSKLYKEEPLLKEYFETAFQALKDLDSSLGNDPLIDKGINLKSWIENPESAPPEEYQVRGSVSVAMIFITQVANYHLMHLKGYPVSDLIAHSAGTTGHSQGIVAAALASVGKDGKEFYKSFYDFTKFIFFLGYRAQEKYPVFEIEKSVAEGNIEVGDKNPSPMVACIGYSKDELEERINRANSDLGLTGDKKLYISLYNTPDSMIISANPSSLIAFRKKYKAEMDEGKKKFVYLKTTAPFHSPLMEGSWEKFQTDLASRAPFHYTSKDLKIPLYSIFTGENLQGSSNLAETLFKDVVIHPLYWNKAVGILFSKSDIHSVLDFGPSVVSGKLTGGQLSAKSIQTPVLCLSNPKDCKKVYE